MKINSISGQKFGQIYADRDKKGSIYHNLSRKEKCIFDFVDACSDNVAQIRIMDDGYVYVRSGNKRADSDIFQGARNLTGKVKIALKFINDPDKFKHDVLRDETPRVQSVRNSDGDSYYCGEAIAPPVEFFGCGW